MFDVERGQSHWQAAHLLIPGLLLHLVLHLPLGPCGRSLEALAEDGAVELVHLLLKLLVLLQVDTNPLR